MTKLIKLKKKHPSLILLLLLLCFKSLAFTDGSSVILAQQLAQLYKQYEEVIEQVRQLQLVNDHLNGVVDGIQAVKREYEFVQNFELQTYIDRIEGDITSLTLLDNLSNNGEVIENMEILLREIQNRVATSDNASQTSKIDRLGENLTVLRESIRVYSEQAAAGSEGMSQADMLSSINSSTSMLAAQALTDRKKDLELQIKRTEQVLQAANNDADFMEYLSNNGGN